MPKFYVSFGQAHAHALNGVTYDKNSLMEVEAPNDLAARIDIMRAIGPKWSMIYPEDALTDVLDHFPRGIVGRLSPLESKE